MNATLKTNLVVTDSKATAKSWQDFMKLLEENTGGKRTIRDFDTPEEIPIRGSPRRLELVVVRPRFMKKEDIGMTKTANAMSGNATKVDKEYLRREIPIHESYFRNQIQYWTFANGLILRHAKII